MTSFVASPLLLKHQCFHLVVRRSYQSCFSYFFLHLQSESITYHLLNRKALPVVVPRWWAAVPGRGTAQARVVNRQREFPARRCGGAGRSRPRPGARHVSRRLRRRGGAAGPAARKMAAGIREKQTGERPPAVPELGRGSGADRTLRPPCPPLSPRGGPRAPQLSAGDSRPLTRLGSPGNRVAAPLPLSPRLCGPGAPGLPSPGPRFSQRDLGPRGRGRRCRRGVEGAPGAGLGRARAVTPTAAVGAPSTRFRSALGKDRREIGFNVAKIKLLLSCPR